MNGYYEDELGVQRGCHHLWMQVRQIMTSEPSLSIIRTKMDQICQSSGPFENKSRPTPLICNNHCRSQNELDALQSSHYITVVIKETPTGDAWNCPHYTGQEATTWQLKLSWHYLSVSGSFPVESQWSQCLHWPPLHPQLPVQFVWRPGRFWWGSITTTWAQSSVGQLSWNWEEQGPWRALKDPRCWIHWPGKHFTRCFKGVNYSKFCQSWRNIVTSLSPARMQLSILRYFSVTLSVVWGQG